MIDFVIPCHSKDLSTLELCVNGVKNISCHNKIYLISENNLNIENTIFIPQNEYDKFVTIDKIKNEYIKRNSIYIDRASWIYQQFLKILSFRVIDNLTKSFVLLDSDTIFLKDVDFNENFFYYSIADEYYLPYLQTIKTLLGVDDNIGFSTINHHMIFNKLKVEMMINDIENKFNNNFVDVVLSVIDYNELSSLSEWDLYANYMILNHNNLCIHRQLKWKDIPFIPNENDLENFKNDYDFVSCHAWMRW